MQENVFEKLLSQILLEYSDRYGTVPDDTKYTYSWCIPKGKQYIRSC